MHQRGMLLLLTFSLLPLSFSLGREALHHPGPPAFLQENHPGILIGLGKGFQSAGIHQFSDGLTLLSVISLTDPSLTLSAAVRAEADFPLRTGEALELIALEKQGVEITRKWLPAGQRVALGIPLHPDRMDLLDWEFLPGVGPKLALLIEEDRQENGDFGSLKSLARVKGIGPKRLESFRPFFYDHKYK